MEFDPRYSYYSRRWYDYEPGTPRHDLVREIEANSGIEIWFGERPSEDHELLAPECFPDEWAPALLSEGMGAGCTGRHSRTVWSRLFSSCAGWPDPKPTPEELYDAVHADQPSVRERTVVRTFVNEASPAEMLRAWAERVYTWRTLVLAVHRIGYDHPAINVFLNNFHRPALKRAHEARTCST